MMNNKYGWELLSAQERTCAEAYAEDMDNSSSLREEENTSNLALKRSALEAFWAVAGLTVPKRKSWHPSPKLAQFLRSI